MAEVGETAWPGRMRRRFLLAAAVVLLAAAALSRPAGAEVLYDQSDSTDPLLVDANDFPAAFDSLDDRAADDFTVPLGERWTIGQIDLIGSGGSAGDLMNISIVRDLNGQPNTGGLGTVFAPPLGYVPTAGGPGDYTLYLGSPPAISPGHYWLVLQHVDPSLLEWSWQARSVQAGSPAAWENPGAGPGNCPNWSVRTTCPGGSGGPDQLFKLSGNREIIPNEFSLGAVTHRPSGSASIAGTFPGKGVAVVTDARRAAPGRPLRIKRRRVPIAAAGVTSLPVLPTRSTGKKLRAGKPVSVAVRVSFTPDQGLPRARSVTLKLRRKPVA